jgi:uncharacterized protein
MLEVTFFRDASDRCSGFSACGHADFAEHGEDIVCAAVSAILQAAHLGLSEHARAELRTKRAPGELELAWSEKERDRESVRAIVAAAELAIAKIARRFPNHVKMKRVRARPASGEKRSRRVTKVPNRRRTHDV